MAAIKNPLRGAVNVAAPGTIGLTRMIRLAGKAALPIARRCSRPRRRSAAGSALSRACRPTSAGSSVTAEPWTRARLIEEVGYTAARSTRPPRSRTTCARRAAGGSCPSFRDLVRDVSVRPPATRGRATSRRGTSWAPPRTPPPPETAPFPIGAALAFLRRLRAGVEAGTRSRLRDRRGDRRRCPRDARAGLERAMRRLAGDYSEDEWGFDEEFADAALPVPRVHVRALVAREVDGHRERARRTAAR